MDQAPESPAASTEDIAQVSPPPAGWGRVTWLGPAFLWMVSAAGSGELLFTPRVGAQYGYSLLWALLAAVALKWFINREIGRFAVCTGSPVLEGFSRLPGPRNWAVWLILVPQLFVAVTIIAGMAATAATAVVLMVPGPLTLWMAVWTLASAAFTLWGRYSLIEKVATFVAFALAGAAVAGAATRFPGAGPLVAGLKPTIPRGMNLGEVLPWLGFMLAGAAGLMWYSYWLSAKGYGARRADIGDRSERQGLIEPARLSEQQRRHLRGWLRQMTLDNTVAVIGTLIPTIAFLILGTELLKPKGLIPEEKKVAETLGRLLGDIWGRFGFWFLVSGLLIGFTGTLLSLHDGFGRLFAHGSGILLRPFNPHGRWTDETFRRRLSVAVLGVVLPIALYLFRGAPVGLLKIAGAIEAAHIPIVTALTLYLNHRMLPKELRASRFVLVLTAVAGLFFAAFTIVYLLQLAGLFGAAEGEPGQRAGSGTRLEAYSAIARKFDSCA